MAMTPGFFRKKETPPLTQACAKRKRNFNGGSWNDEGMKGETVQMPEAFGIKSGKRPNFGRIKADFSSFQIRQRF
jgi:hypothetical protein